MYTVEDLIRLLQEYDPSQPVRLALWNTESEADIVDIDDSLGVVFIEFEFAE